MPVSGRFNRYTPWPLTFPETVKQQAKIVQNSEQAGNQNQGQDGCKGNPGRQGEGHGNKKSGLQVLFQDQGHEAADGTEGG